MPTHIIRILWNKRVNSFCALSNSKLSICTLEFLSSYLVLVFEQHVLFFGAAGSVSPLLRRGSADQSLAFFNTNRGTPKSFILLALPGIPETSMAYLVIMNLQASYKALNRTFAHSLNFISWKLKLFTDVLLSLQFSDWNLYVVLNIHVPLYIKQYLSIINHPHIRLTRESAIIL